MTVGNSLNFPSFIKAKTADALSGAMMKNNLVHRKEFTYYDIQFVKGEWYAWFYFDHSAALKGVKRAK